MECQNRAVCDQLRENGAARLAAEYFGPTRPVEFRYADVQRKTHQVLQAEAAANPVVASVIERFGAKVLNVTPRPERSS